MATKPHKPKIELRSNNTARVTYFYEGGGIVGSFVVAPSQSPNNPEKRRHPVDMALDLLINHGVLPGDRVKALDRMLGLHDPKPQYSLEALKAI